MKLKIVASLIDNSRVVNYTENIDSAGTSHNDPNKSKVQATACTATSSKDKRLGVSPFWGYSAVQTKIRMTPGW